MPARIYIDHSLLAVPADARLVITGGQAHHLRNVLRTSTGEVITLFDGRGASALARVAGFGRGEVEVEVLSVDGEVDASPTGVILATAVPKGERSGWLVEKATELGVERWIPLRTRRSTVDPGEGKLRKLRATVVEASKQCQRNRLMDVGTPVALADLLATWQATAASILVAHQDGVAWRPQAARDPVLVIVGPEGGLTPQELDQCRAAGAQFVSLGPRTLRVETAALVMASLCQLARGQATQAVGLG